MSIQTSTPISQNAINIMGTGSLSRQVSGLTIILSTVQRNLQIARRYLPNLIGSLAEMAIRAAFFLILANSIAFNSNETIGVEFTGKTLYTFLLGSLVLFIFNRSTMWGPLNAVTNDLYNGTLEYLYSLPGSRYAYYVGVVLSEVVISQVVFIPLFILLVFQASVSLSNILMMMLACLLVLTTLTALGIMIALLALLWRQVGSIVTVLSILFELLAGAYMPISAFPPVIRVFSYLLPFTWGFDLVRYYSFSGRWQTILPVWQEWAVLTLFAIVFTILSRYLLGKAERTAKNQGLHII